ncbi:hypothetical protein [Nocardioides sp.]|uniref:hypothetical protein n=1 Tax=Nocardioides sp. TaxID=35761 RepID=UPI003783A02E
MIGSLDGDEHGDGLDADAIKALTFVEQGFVELGSLIETSDPRDVADWHPEIGVRMQNFDDTCQWVARRTWWRARMRHNAGMPAPSAEPSGRRVDPGTGRLDRRILISNLASGAAWLLLLTPPWSDGFGGLGLFLLGAAYVGAVSVFFAFMYARANLTRRQELATWVGPWLLACLLWSDLLSGLSPDPGQSWAAAAWMAVFFGFLVGTPCYLAWQVLALVVRQVWAWRSGESLLPEDVEG